MESDSGPMPGYAGKYAEVDLSTGKTTVAPIPRRLVERFVGGKGLGLALMWEMDKSRDALDPANPIIFLTGPLTATSAQTSGRSCLVTRSPLTGNFLDSHAGGTFGPALKWTGHDYLVVKGASKDPVYIRLTPQGAFIEGALAYWGKNCVETEKALQQKHGDVHVASIGPAGENLVRFACVTADVSRNFGRGGAGAVMGSKKLKAVVVEGKEKFPLHDEAKFKDLSVQLTKDVSGHAKRKLRYDLGTMMWVRMGQEEGGFLPTKNFQKGQFDQYEKITSEAMAKTLDWKHSGCHNCVIHCSKNVKWNGKEIDGPEYETTAYLGSGCLVDDPWAIAESNWLCNDLGLDSISSGVTCSFAMEAVDKGVLEAPWLKWGDAGAQHKLLKMIAHREGIGDMLAEGTRRASRKLGKGSERYAIQIGGMEMSGVNPLGAYSMLLGLATADFASHTRIWSATDEMKGNLKLDGSLIPYVQANHDEINARNSLIVCDFLMYGFDRLAPMVEAATGVHHDPASMMLMGERIHNLARLYNLRTGRSAKDDRDAPGRFFDDVSVSGLMKGRKVDRAMFEGHVAEYYRHRGWDETGRPTKETLERLGMTEYA